MIAIFDDAAQGDEQAVQQALAVCGVCPIRRRCREQALDAAPWPEGEGPRGVVAGVVVGLRGQPRLDRLQVTVAAWPGGDQGCISSPSGTVNRKMVHQ